MEQSESEGIIEPSKNKVQVILGQVNLTDKNDRLTLRVDAYCETALSQPKGDHVIISKLLDNCGIEPYIRKFKATENPKELFLGDIDRDQVGYILIVNTEGTKLLQTPTEAERADIEARVVLINDFEVHPNGLPFLGQPKRDCPLTVRCLHGQAILQVCIFPR